MRSYSRDSPAFSIAAIENLPPRPLKRRCLIAIDHKVGGIPVKSENPYSPTPGKSDEYTAPPPSRFIDEKISDESGTESNSDSALAPAGLKNPFWN